MPAPIETALAEYLAALQPIDIDRYVNAFAPNGIAHDPVGTPPVEGHDALRSFITGIQSACQSFNLTPNIIIPGGNNSAAIKWTSQIINHAGKTLTFEGIDLVECNDEGKVILAKAYWNATPVMAFLQN